MRQLGYPVLPDSFITASGMSESFSPQTPDALMVSILQSQGQQLPADLAAKWAAAQAGTPPPSSSPANPANGALTPSGQPISTQTGQAVTLVNTIAIAPGVFSCVMSDGSSHYCDANSQPISYTPPAPVPMTTPAAGSQPTSTVSPVVTPAPQTGITSVTPVAVTPAGGQISTTTGTPASTTVLPAGVQSTLDSLTTWLKGSLIGGVPNWLILGGAAAAFFMFSDGASSSGRRR